ncbi:MAG: glutamyl-tRNA reductase [Cyclobacteriaceae bacterium]|nr:glutamyl-tRNA reductase [Cyclobacteriaceae bacterium]MCH8517099.1 glutamyl-tRNA reductase [Cyclobacteriaceae bacterium]
MNKNFRVLSLSFKNAPLNVREIFALSESGIGRLLAYVKEFTDLNDVLAISTCNRTEIYYSAVEDKCLELMKIIGLIKGVDHAVDHAGYFVSLNGDEAVERLFRVSIGLEAQVIGDLQIANQIKRAYQATADADLAGPYLHRLLHTIFFTSKRVVQETSFRDGAASVSYAATELVESLAGEKTVPSKVLVLGLGEIGKDVAKNLSETKNVEITICNRTKSKAEEAALAYGYRVADFESAYEEILAADIVVSSVGLDKPFITKELVAQQKLLSHKFFIDLSVPRSVEPCVEEVNGVLLYNIDNIQSKANEALERRLAAIPDVEAIIEQSLAEFNDWSKEALVSPTINKLKQALEEIRQQELARFTKKATESEAKLIDQVTKSMMQKVLKTPVLQLKAACKRGEEEALMGIIGDLFDLEKAKEAIEK